MHGKLGKVLAVLVLLAVVFGWFITVKGLPGVMGPVANGIQRGLDIEGGVYVVLEAQDTEDYSDEELSELMDRTSAVINNRVDAMGLSNPTVSVEAGNRIRVELPGMEDANEAIEMIGKTAKLEFVLADGTHILDGGQVEDASLSMNSNQGGYCVELKFDADGRKAFENATKITSQGGVNATIAYPDGTLVQNNAVVILLDGEVISAPTAKEVISSDSCIIEGNFTKDEAANLAALIKGGALPVELQEITSSSQTATIGVDAFHKSVMGGLIGLLIIFLLMIFFYRIMGLAADIALALYVVLILIAMRVMGNVLTLPGIAGIILSIGMAVDANVIIFNRIREEIAGGKSVRAATKTGYKRALSTVIDAQVTTLIATVILYQLGTSAVKGFAWTLMLGIIVSIFTAVIITQLYLLVFSSSKRFGTLGAFGMNKDGSMKFRIKHQFNFIKHRKKFFSVSAAIIIVGLIITVTPIGLNYGIDFTGGTMLHIDTGKHVAESEVMDVAKAEGLNTDQMQIIYTGEDNSQVQIKTRESLDKDERQSFINALQKEFKFEDDAVLESEHFGPSVGNELKKNALMALAIAAIGMLIYIRLRFRQWKFGGAALLGVLHDVLILVSFYGIFRVTVNNPFIAAILTVVGYSINDTIVIFDRVRENLKFMKGKLDHILDTSVNQTLSRSLMTSLTTLLVMIPLIILGGATIRQFVVPLMVGVLAGTYSSIFICSPLYYVFETRAEKSAYQKQIEASQAHKKSNYVKKDKSEESLAKEEARAAEHEAKLKAKQAEREAREAEEKLAEEQETADELIEETVSETADEAAEVKKAAVPEEQFISLGTQEGEAEAEAMKQVKKKPHHNSGAAKKNGSRKKSRKRR